MRTGLILLLLTAITVFTACVDKSGVEPRIKESQLDIDQTISTDSFENVHNGLIFENVLVFLDPGPDIIYGYDLKGKQIFTIDNSVIDEEYRPAYMFVDKVRNSLAIVNGYKNEILYFNIRGTLEETYESDFGYLVFSRSNAEDSELINYAKPRILDDDSIIENRIVLLDRDFAHETVIYESSYSALNNYNLTGSLISTDCSDGIYLTERSIDDYKIFRYNFNGEQKKTIKKKYSRIRKGDDEADAAAKHARYINNILKMDGSDGINSDFMYYNSIESMQVKNNGELWVRTHDEDGSCFDIYDCDGVLTGKCRINSDIYGRIMFLGNDAYGFTQNGKGKYVICKLKLKDL